jgi:phosphoribosyl-AMP cyclohydrolase / phosphoribosyl-ATP pyrophosphohydrolase
MIPEMNWSKANGLIPAVVQDARTAAVLMVGFMNPEALEITLATNKVTFYSRTKQRIWTKGETSGNFLDVVRMTADCDRDTLLIQASPHGSVCHLGTSACFGEDTPGELRLLGELEKTITQRRADNADTSYTARLFTAGRDRITQKVGEEAVEVVIAAKNADNQKFVEECSDLIYHLTVLLIDRGISWENISSELKRRRRLPSSNSNAL